MIIRPTDICDDVDKAKLAFVRTAQALDMKFDCRLTTMWRIDTEDWKLFIELAREECDQPN